MYLGNENFQGKCKRNKVERKYLHLWVVGDGKGKVGGRKLDEFQELSSFHMDDSFI